MDSTPQRTPSATAAIAPITAKTSAPDAESGKARKVVSPISPSEPGTSSQNPGRNIAYTGIVDWRRASWYATTVITTAPTKPLE